MTDNELIQLKIHNMPAFDDGEWVGALLELRDTNDDMLYMRLHNTFSKMAHDLREAKEAINDGETLQKRIIRRALEAETNESTFRKFLEDAHSILARLSNTNATITNLRYRILDALNETPTVDERLDTRIVKRAEVRAKLLVDVQVSGDSAFANYKAGMIGTIEETDVVGYDYEFYPFRQVGVCVRKEEIEILP